jgi:hypothetical protein
MKILFLHFTGGGIADRSIDNLALERHSFT